MKKIPPHIAEVGFFFVIVSTLFNAHRCYSRLLFYLFKRSHQKHVHFVLSEETVFATRNILLG